MLQKVRKQAKNVTAEMRNDPAVKSKETRLDRQLLAKMRHTLMPTFC